MTSSATGATEFVAPLTSLRFVAAMMVLIQHYWVLPGGYAGVGFFFVLSGYVLALNYADRVGSKADRQNFWLRRFARIAPTYLLTYLAMLPIGWAILDILPSLFGLQSWFPFPGIYHSPNAPAWSISNEAFFYALFPGLIAVRGRTLAIWIAVLASLASVWTAVFPDWTMETIVPFADIDANPTLYAFYILPPARLLEFAIGIWLARQPKREASTPAELGAIAFAVGSIVLLPLWPPAFQCALFFLPASIVVIRVFSRSRGVISKILCDRRLVLLGDASFMLYMIHWPIARYLGTNVLTASLAILLSIVLHIYFEKPMQRSLLTFHRRWRSSDLRRSTTLP